MGRPTRPLHDAGNHGTFERRSLRQAARRGRLPTRPDLPETWSGPALLHHAEGHDPAIFVIVSVVSAWVRFRALLEGRRRDQFTSLLRSPARIAPSGAVRDSADHACSRGKLKAL